MEASSHLARLSKVNALLKDRIVIFDVLLSMVDGSSICTLLQYLNAFVVLCFTSTFQCILYFTFYSQYVLEL